MGAGVATSPHCPEFDDLAWVQQGGSAQAVWVRVEASLGDRPFAMPLPEGFGLAGKLPDQVASLSHEATASLPSPSATLPAHSADFLAEFCFLTPTMA